MEDLVLYEDLILESFDFVPMESKDICTILESKNISNNTGKIKAAFAALKTRIIEFFKKVKTFIKDKVYRFMYGSGYKNNNPGGDPKSFAEKTGTIHDELIPKDFDFYRGLGEVMECLEPFQNGLTNFENALKAFDMSAFIKDATFTAFRREKYEKKMRELDKYFTMDPVQLVTNGKLSGDDYRNYPKRIFSGFFGDSTDKIHVSELDKPTVVKNLKANFDKFSNVLDGLEKQLLNSVKNCETMLNYTPDTALIYSAESILKHFQQKMLTTLSKGASIITNVCNMSLKSCAQAVKLQSSINDFVEKRSSYVAPKSQKEKEEAQSKSKYKALPSGGYTESFVEFELMDFNEYEAELESLSVITSDYDEFLGVMIESANPSDVKVQQKLKMLQQRILLLIQKASQFLDKIIAETTKLASNALWQSMKVLMKSTDWLENVAIRMRRDEAAEKNKKLKEDQTKNQIARNYLYKMGPAIKYANEGLNIFLKNYADAINAFDPNSSADTTNEETSLSIIFNGKYQNIDEWIASIKKITEAEMIEITTAAKFKEVASYLKSGAIEKSLRKFEKMTNDLKKEVNDRLKSVIAISRRKDIGQVGYQKCIQLVQAGTALLSTIQHTLNAIRKFNYNNMNYVKMFLSYGSNKDKYETTSGDEKATTESFYLADEWGCPIPEKKKNLREEAIQQLLFM